MTTAADKRPRHLCKMYPMRRLMRKHNIDLHPREQVNGGVRADSAVRARALSRTDQSSRPGGAHPQALTDRDVKVSAHPALPCTPVPASIDQWAKSAGS